jgi:hypothetical protein
MLDHPDLVRSAVTLVQRPRRRRIEEFEQRGLGSGLRWNLASSGKENDA